MATQPLISPTQWTTPTADCPAWTGYPTRESLPAGLAWTASFELPAIGSRVHVSMNGFGLATVQAYFHAEGYLGVIVKPDVLPAWFSKQQPGVTLGHFFGRELRLVEEAPTAKATA